MIRTITKMVCDGADCGDEFIGCDDLCTSENNREMNAVVMARWRGWKREHWGGRMMDYCPSCYEKFFRSFLKEG